MRRRRPRYHRRLSDRTLTALHEAGHAVAAVMVGRGFYSVGITINDDRLGTTQLSYLKANARPERALAEIVVALAGIAAEIEIYGSPRGCEADIRDAAQWCLRVDADFFDMLEAARKLVLKHWAAIERVAAVLLDVGTLRAVEVRRLARATYN